MVFDQQRRIDEIKANMDSMMQVIFHTTLFRIANYLRKEAWMEATLKTCEVAFPKVSTL